MRRGGGVDREGGERGGRMRSGGGVENGDEGRETERMRMGGKSRG